MEIVQENHQWLGDLALDRFVIIAGPCSTEIEEQVLNIAHSLKDIDVSFFRAGIQEPRTYPSMFKGVGALGLRWLQCVREETGLKMATEVANKDHIEPTLEHNINLLWIGTRSTVSPLTIRKVADELRGTGRIVLMRNPVNPDLVLWTEAIEWLQRTGVEKLGMTYRGLSIYEETEYHNIPEW